MDQQERLLPSVETKITHMDCNKGTLCVYTKYAHGQKVMEAFTLESLADCMGMTMTTMEGRYQRGRLHNLAVGIPTGRGRPVRGFPLTLIHDVIRIVNTPGAKVTHSQNGDRLDYAEMAPVVDLVPSYQDGKRFYTMKSLADHFGVSVTTVRNKMDKSGLRRRMVNLGSSIHGGRPTKALPESLLGDAKLAIVNGAMFETELDRIIAAGMRPGQQEAVLSHVAPHIPPPPNSMRAFDPATLAPVVPSKPLAQVNAVNQSNAAVDELMAEIESMEWTLPGAAPAAEKAPDPAPNHTAVQSVAGQVDLAEHWRTPQFAWADTPGEHASAALLFAFDALTNEPVMPTRGEIADQCNWLAGVTREQADGLFARVRAYWEAK